MTVKIPQILALFVAVMTVAGCGAGDAAKGKQPPPPLVKAEPATTIRFVDSINAIGTAFANEQVTVAASVTERIMRLNFDDGQFVRPKSLSTGDVPKRISDELKISREASSF